MYHDINPNADLEGIHIFNFSSGKGTISNKSGMFRLSVSIGDTLSVSALQYEKATVAVRFEHFVSKKIRIELLDNANLLDEVFLTNRTLSGFLNLDAQNIETEPLYDSEYFGLPSVTLKEFTPVERRIRAQNSGQIDRIINSITGKNKLFKKHLEAEKAGMIIEKLTERFPETFFNDEIGIPEDLVYDFIYFCELDEDFKSTIQKDVMAIIDYFKKKAGEYRLLRENSEE